MRNLDRKAVQTPSIVPKIIKILKANATFLAMLFYGVLNTSAGIFVKNLQFVKGFQIGALRMMFQLLLILPILQTVHLLDKSKQKKRRKKLAQKGFTKPLIDEIKTRTPETIAYYKTLRNKFSFLPEQNEGLIVTILFAARAMTGTAGMACLYAALQIMPISDVQVFNFSCIYVTSFLSWIFLGETLDLLGAAAMMISFAGCLLVSQPETLLKLATGKTEDLPKDAALGVTFCFSILFLYGVSLFFSKLTGKKAQRHVIVDTCYYAVFGCLMTWPASYIENDFQLNLPSLHDLGLLFCMTLVLISAQMAYVYALYHDSAYRISLFASTQLLVAVFYDFTLYDVLPNLYSSLGIVLIFAGVLLEFYRGYMKSKNSREKL